MKKTALISVYQKAGIVDFAKELIALGWDIIASGGTAKALAQADIPVRDVADLAGGGAILGHRVVTLSREIHAALLARNTEEDNKELEALGIPRIDLVCVDLYPLSAEIKKPDSTANSVIEMTDIGGPTMLRSAAKGRRIVICDPMDRGRAIAWLKAGEPDKEKFVDELAAKAEGAVAEYALISARYRSNGKIDGIIGHEIASCKYGENAWQAPAALYGFDSDDPLSLDKFKLVEGTEPSYNNYCDIDRLLQTMIHLAAAFELNRGSKPMIAIGAKHGNACGASFGFEKNEQVLRDMLDGDLDAIFGGLVMINFPIGEKEAEILMTYKMEGCQRRLLDGIIAPAVSEKAIEMLKRKNDKCRILTNPALGNVRMHSLDKTLRFRQVRGGFLRQPNYTYVIDLNDPELKKYGNASVIEEETLLLAWAVGCTSTSNTITIGIDQRLIANAVGQQSRVAACRLARMRAEAAGHDTKNAVAYSDSFFPFTDGPKALKEMGVRLIYASSGSIKDQEIIDFCQNNGITLYTIPDKKGRGFYGH